MRFLNKRQIGEVEIVRDNKIYKLDGAVEIEPGKRVFFQETGAETALNGDAGSVNMQLFSPAIISREELKAVRGELWRRYNLINWKHTIII